MVGIAFNLYYYVFESMGVVLEGQMFLKRLKTQSLYHEVLLLQKFIDILGKVLKHRKKSA